VSRTRIKICGITRRRDAQDAIAAGADALGLVFYADSPRAVTIAEASSIIAELPPLVSLVGLFVDADAAFVEEACRELPLTMLQFHGNEKQEYCAGFGLPWMKAVRVGPDTDVPAAIADYPKANAVLLDTWRAGVAGGTGERFDWNQVPTDAAQALVLAGGLNPLNVAEAISMTRPYAVDVSGGVESAPGVKDADKIQAFVAAVSAADQR